MTGIQLKDFLKEQKVDNKKVNLSELARFCGITRQGLNEKFKSEKEDLNLNKQISDFLKIPLSELVPGLPPIGKSGGDKNSIDYREELIKVFAENVQLHITVADRGELIIKFMKNSK